MNNHETQLSKIHNGVLVVITVASTLAVVASISFGWEFWVPPLIIIGVIAAWILNVTRRGDASFRENYYVILSMLVSFYHGIHETSFFDVVAVSALLMVTVTLLMRREFLVFIISEFFIIIIIQIIMAVSRDSMEFDSLFMSRLFLDIVVEFSLYKLLNGVLKIWRKSNEELALREREKESDRTEVEDFLVNVSHELRTPVNVINGMSALILKKEDRDDVESIRDAGLRLSRQIEDIQDYSEIQRGDVALENEKYMITSLINDVLADYHMREKRKDLELVVDLDPDVPAVMRGDARKISKIIKHLLSNAFKFTARGGVYMKISGTRRDYGVNLMIEVMDTGVGMSEEEIEKLSKGSYQANRGRNRSTGGIGLGLPVCFGFVRKMNGFVTIDSELKKGTDVRVSIAQEIVDPSPCMSGSKNRFVNVAFHVTPEKYKVAAVREFYKDMATNMAAGFRVNLYSAPSLKDLKTLLGRGSITHVFLGPEEYEAAPGFFDELAAGGTVVAVSAPEEFKLTQGSRVILMPKPLYGYAVARILSGEKVRSGFLSADAERRPVLDGVRALVVDDEAMNLVVATGLLKDYNMEIETASSGREAIEKYTGSDYDVVFMDHMMPGMDGVEAMKRIKGIAAERKRVVCVIALTANAVSGAREMFASEGFDGFISKPIDIGEFERTMNRSYLHSVKEGGWV